MLIQEPIELCPENNMEYINTKWEHSSVFLPLVLHLRVLKVINDAVNTIFLYIIGTKRH